MQLGLDVDLAAEYEIEELFDHLRAGRRSFQLENATASILLSMTVSKSRPRSILRAASHATLVHMSHAQFASPTATARHGTFSVQA